MNVVFADPATSVRTAWLCRDKPSMKETPRAAGVTQRVEAGYMANAYVRVRHPDYDVLRGMLDTVGRTLHVSAS